MPALDIPSVGDLTRITDDVWDSFLETNSLTHQPISCALPVSQITACVHLSGAYTGSVMVQCSEAAAWLIASALFAAPAESLSESEMTDAIGEVANMIGGNVKSLVPGPSTLSLPTVAHGADSRLSVPGVETVREIAVDWHGHPIIVSLLQRTMEG